MAFGIDVFVFAIIFTVFVYFFFFKQKTAYEIGLGIPAEPLFRSSVDKQASHFVHIPGLSYSGVKSPTECQQSLLSLILHLGNLFLIVQLHFSKLFLILKSGVNHTSRGSISTSTLPSI